MAEVLKGAPVAEKLALEAKTNIEHLKAKGISPTLAIVRVGEKPDDISYERNAIKRCELFGAEVKSVILPTDVTQDDLNEKVLGLSTDKSVHGVLIFRPLPNHINPQSVFENLCPSKDIDGVTVHSLAGVFSGDSDVFSPCTAQAVLEILDYYNIDCTGKNIAVVGRSMVVGKPVAVMLLAKNATVTVCHTRTVDLKSITKASDIIIVATGKAEGLTKDYFSSGQVVIDVGINWNEEKGKLCGDVKFDEVAPIVSAITPVPGGVGTVTTSVMVSNVVKAALG